MALTAVSRPEGRFIICDDAEKKSASNGYFYSITGPSEEDAETYTLRVDKRFEHLIQEELASLAADRLTSFFVVPDDHKPNDLNAFRIELVYYQERYERAQASELPTFEQVFEPLPKRETEGVKDVTTTVPMAVWASLRSGHERQKARFPRFRDYVADVLGRSVALLELG